MTTATCNAYECLKGLQCLNLFAVPVLFIYFIILLRNQSMWCSCRIEFRKGLLTKNILYISYYYFDYITYRSRYIAIYYFARSIFQYVMIIVQKIKNKKRRHWRKWFVSSFLKEQFPKNWNNFIPRVPFICNDNIVSSIKYRFYSSQ